MQWTIMNTRFQILDLGADVIRKMWEEIWMLLNLILTLHLKFCEALSSVPYSTSVPTLSAKSQLALTCIEHYHPSGSHKTRGVFHKD